MRKVIIGCLTVLLTWAAAGAAVPDKAKGDPAARPELDARIEVATFERVLMAAAIFDETNRVRESLGLRPFRHLPKLDDAADLEAGIGKVYQAPSHTNPFPSIGTPLARVKYVGLNPRMVAENIALLSIYEGDLSAGVGVIVREGRQVIVNPRTRLELKPATYRGFAAKVVNGWMESPGHRANLVNPAMLYLGCAVQPTLSISAVDSLFCVQVFFTPAN